MDLRAALYFFLQFDLVDMMQVFKASFTLLLLLLFYSGSVVCQELWAGRHRKHLSDQLSPKKRSTETIWQFFFCARLFVKDKLKQQEEVEKEEE